MKFNLWKLIQDIFAPTDRNGGLAYALSLPAFDIYLIFVVVLILSPAYVRNQQLADLSAPLIFSDQRVIDLINVSRLAAGLTALRENSVLAGAAADKAGDMFQKQYFAHVSPEEKTPWDFIQAHNYQYSAAGENLAYDFPTAEDAHVALLASPSHRENILSPRYVEIGVAVKQGLYQGRPSIMIVQYFGAPKDTSVAAAKPVRPEREITVPVIASQKPTLSVRSAPVAALPAAKKTGGASPVAAASATPASGVLSAAESISPAGKDLLPIPQSRTGLPLNLMIAIPSFAGIAIICLALALQLIYRRNVPREVALLALAFVVLLGYLAAEGSQEVIQPRLTPVAFSNIIAE